MSDRLPFHPLSESFPLMPEDSAEFRQLVEDIRVHGQREAITVVRVKGQRLILDGTNRYLAAKAAQVPPAITHFRGKQDDAHLLSFVVSRNLQRRHLTAAQRAEVIRKLRDQGVSTRLIAEKTGTSKGTVDRALKAGASHGAPPTVGVPGVVEEAANGVIEPRRITGRDGRRYRARGARTAPAKVEMLQMLTAEDRATKHVDATLRLLTDLPHALGILGRDHALTRRVVAQMETILAKIGEKSTS